MYSLLSESTWRNSLVPDATPGVPDQTKLSFTEEMKGFVTKGESDYDRGFREGQNAHSDLMFHLTITVTGVFDFVSKPATTAAAVGWVRSNALGGQFPVTDGWFNLFVDQGTPTLKHMTYRLFFQDASRQPLTFSGFKVIRDDPGFDVWLDTTTLFTRILEGHVQQEEEANARLVAGGILHLSILDFMQQLTTFRVDGPTAVQKASALSRFGTFFMGGLWEVYGAKVQEHSA